MTRKSLFQSRPAIQFDPVPRRARRDGWTVERQRLFIETLARTGSLRTAAESVQMSEPGAIYLRKQDGAESFCAAWDAAVASGSSLVRDKLVDHALNGIPEEVWHDGKIVGQRRKYNHRSMMWIVENGDKRAEKQSATSDLVDVARMRKEITRRLDLLFISTMSQTIECAKRRAAYEVLEGPTDWTSMVEQLAFVRNRLKGGRLLRSWE